MISRLLFLVVIAFIGFSCEDQVPLCQNYSCVEGGIIRGDTTSKSLALVFTGGDYADGGLDIAEVLFDEKVEASFFFTGDFYRNSDFWPLISQLKNNGHYMGGHSDKHLLYCTWEDRDKLLVSKEEFLEDLAANYHEMKRFGIYPQRAHYFMPPYEWYNEKISQWTQEAGYQIVNFSPGTRSNADYTTPDMANYRSSEEIYQSIVDFEGSSSSGLNGFILLIHIGTAPERTDKFYCHLGELVNWLKSEGYSLKRIDELLALQ